MTISTPCRACGKYTRFPLPFPPAPAPVCKHCGVACDVERVEKAFRAASDFLAQPETARALKEAEAAIERGEDPFPDQPCDHN